MYRNAVGHTLCGEQPATRPPADGGRAGERAWGGGQLGRVQHRAQPRRSRVVDGLRDVIVIPRIFYAIDVVRNGVRHARAGGPSRVRALTRQYV